MSASESGKYALLDRLAEEFAERLRRGERPSLKEYLDRHPDLADDIRDLFPAMVEVEQAEGDRREADRPAAATAPLEQLGDFRILREVGQGGMGVVYEAEQVSLGRHVALKVLTRKMLPDARAKRRFEREAKAAARLHHTNIVPVFGVGAHDGVPYYVMQFIHGQGLDLVLDELKQWKAGNGSSPSREGPVADLARSLLTGQFQAIAEPSPVPEGTSDESPEAAEPNPPFAPGPLPAASETRAVSSGSITLPGQSGETHTRQTRKQTYWQSVAGVGVQVADALEHAHRQGIVHRDVKPSNLLLDAQGRVWVTDFGLAKADDQKDLTQDGDILGTPRYMPPEAFEGRTGPCSDVYSLGLTLYELVALRPAFAEKERAKLVRRITTEDAPRLRDWQPGVPRDLETIIHKAIDRDPARRYQTAGELAADLQRFLDDVPIRARPVGAVERTWKWAKRRPALAALLGVVLLALVSLAVLSGNLAVARHNADEKRQAAEKEADKARKARDFLVGIFRIRDIRAGNTTTARQILNQAEQDIPIEFADQPELRDELLAAIEDVNRNLDRTIPAAMILEARGAIQVHSPRGDSARPVPQTLLYPDDRLTLAADAQVQLVFLSDLHKERLQPGQEATIGRKGCSPADAVRERDDSVLMTFVRLPRGTFYMGWNGNPGSAKKTEINEDFEIAVHDVTQGQWEAIMGMGNNPSWFSRKNYGRNYVLDISDEELKLFPVENVSWDDAQEFLKKLNEKEAGRGYWYRLPSEAEWEYACRGGATSLEECSYHFYLDKPTNDLSLKQANFNGNYAFGKAPNGPYLKRPTRVGAYPSNKLGLCDMHGNVWQWTAAAEGLFRVSRGGCWDSQSNVCRASDRSRLGPTFRGNFMGFRLARVPVR
jgi:serine/threonine protein kinase/formylglycine-generating enzyme required for sulfatase activity